MCDNLINALKLLANQQKDGDSPVEMVVQGLQERSRLRIMDGLRKFIMVENHEAVKVGELEKNMESRKVVMPKFTTDFPEAVAREGSDELTLRADEEGALRIFIDTTNVGDKKRWEPPLVDGDWHAICQAIFQGVEGSQWETVFYKYVELHKAAKFKKILRKQEGQGALVFARRKRQRNKCLRSGQCAEDSNKIPSEVGPLGNPPEEPDSCPGKRTANVQSKKSGKASSATSEF